MSKHKKPKQADPKDADPFDEAAAAQMAADVAAAGDGGDEQSDELSSFRDELKKAKDHALRSQAELENYRKRVSRDQQVQHRYAHLSLMRDLLPVLDNMDRAIEAAEQTHDADSLLEGVKIVAQQLQGVLGKFDCVKIEALDGPFDPHLHEAIMQQPSDEHPKGTVLQVTQTGFQLHDRVVRPAQVIVSAENPPPQPEVTQETEESSIQEDAQPPEEADQEP